MTAKKPEHLRLSRGRKPRRNAPTDARRPPDTIGGVDTIALLIVMLERLPDWRGLSTYEGAHRALKHMKADTTETTTRALARAYDAVIDGPFSEDKSYAPVHLRYHEVERQWLKALHARGKHPVPIP